MADARLHVFVSGKVQGVYFRDSTRREARSLNLTGWVRNLRDRRVEAVLEGSREKAEEMLSWCHKGPPEASVTNVEHAWEPATGEFIEFTIRYS